MLGTDNIKALKYWPKKFGTICMNRRVAIAVLKQLFGCFRTTLMGLKETKTKHLMICILITKIMV